jgi:hypothetical protein
MSDWRIQLSSLVDQRETALFPLQVYRVAPASGQEWPHELPVSVTLMEFYARCDGGYIADYQWSSLSELPDVNRFWIEALAGYYLDGSGPLIPRRHLVFAIDSGGAPTIWDCVTDHVAAFWFKGGDWEPTGQTMEEFLTALFSPADSSDLWFQALQQLSEAV